MRRSRRFFFYSHDGLGLGHVRRNLAVASAVVASDPLAAVLVATSVEGVERFGIPPRVDILKLPGLRKLGNERYTPRRLPISFGSVRALRAHLLSAAVTEFRPMVMLVDKHPLGVGRELEAALGEARAVGARTVLGFRDVLDSPKAVRAQWTRHGLYERISHWYDLVLVYGQRDVFDSPREYAFPPELEAITHFCGYVVSPAGNSENGRHAPKPEDVRPRVLAAAGGGEDGFPLLATFVEAAAGAGWQATVVSGPQLDAEQARRLAALAAEGGIAFRRFAPHLASELRSVDALVCMGGYNTLAEAAAGGVSTVCVPRTSPRMEQFLRARAFADRGLLTLIEPEHLSVATLRSEVEAALASSGVRRLSRIRPLDLGGAARAAHDLLDLACGGAGRSRRAPRVAAR